MDARDIKKHWEKNAEQYKTDLMATTKTPTIKELEINALYNAIEKMQLDSRKTITILEVGCGNGHNCFALSKMLPLYNFTGVDYVEQMISNAKEIKRMDSNIYKNTKFLVGNVLELDKTCEEDSFDVVFTDRCIINLNSITDQLKACDQLIGKVKSGGYLVILENIIQNYEQQNDLRETVGLKRRVPDSYNLFIDEEVFLNHVKNSMELLCVNDFASIHDVVLYILVPMINGGNVDYNHPAVQAVTELCLKLPQKYINDFGSFGQNRLFVFRKPV